MQSFIFQIEYQLQASNLGVQIVGSLLWV